MAPTEGWVGHGECGDFQGEAKDASDVEAMMDALELRCLELLQPFKLLSRQAADAPLGLCDWNCGLEQRLRGRLEIFHLQLGDAVELTVRTALQLAKAALAAAPWPAPGELSGGEAAAAADGAAGKGVHGRFSGLPSDLLDPLSTHLDMPGLGAFSACNAACRLAYEQDKIWRPFLQHRSASASTLCMPGKCKQWLQQELRSARPPQLSEYVLCLDVHQFGTPVFAGCMPIRSHSGFLCPGSMKNQLEDRSLQLLQLARSTVASQVSCELRLAHRSLGCVARFENNVSIVDGNVPLDSKVFGCQGIECIFCVYDSNGLADIAREVALGGIDMADVEEELRMPWGINFCIAVDSEGGRHNGELHAGNLVGAVTFRACNDLHNDEAVGGVPEDLAVRTLFPLQVWQSQTWSSRP